jgi:hypothetical protein
MMSRSALFLGIAALVGCAGCASLGFDTTSGENGMGAASPPTVQNGVQECTSGVYNRAAGLCASEGP